ncbi:hypothetical protein D4Y10_23305 [Salmonella enterica subsp. enterica serovar Oranienburg]|nr:hypothetical protein [Salmonella enterica subsp. enterica serovar Vitkin]EBY4132367.1 hypothetical protein [Salmonella enterica subsp. enterica serovar Oranienburg]ECC1694899.1 hypothetical protein [Salmonella enterica subsp. salamae]EEO2382760.1 hypothetical protein [Salmonella enterica]ECI4078042.1 hypothetical protein [Salmonella enterica subsp. salamae]
MNNQLTDKRSRLREAAKNYQTALAWYQSNIDSPAALQVWDAATSEFMSAIGNRETDIIAELLDEVDELVLASLDAVASYPEKLPCPVFLEPGLRFGKGVTTSLMLGALQRRAEYYAELDAMTPEQRAEHDAGIAEFKAMLGNTEVPVPEEIKHRIGGLDWGWEGEFNRGWNACIAAMRQAGNSPAIGIDPALGPDKSVEIRYFAPPGWVMVPIEPTEHMIAEGFESEPDEFFSKPEVWKAYQAMSGCQQAAYRAKLCWAAMIAAVPTKEGA